VQSGKDLGVKTAHKKTHRPAAFPVGLWELREESRSPGAVKPSVSAEGLRTGCLAVWPVIYCMGGVVGLAWCVCRTPSGSRACGLIAFSSTGVVPCTSLVKVAPAGTR